MSVPARVTSAIQDRYRTTFHRDGSATIWNVYTQQWVRYTEIPSHDVLASLTPKERKRIIRHMGRAEA